MLADLQGHLLVLKFENLAWQHLLQDSNDSKGIDKKVLPSSLPTFAPVAKPRDATPNPLDKIDDAIIPVLKMGIALLPVALRNILYLKWRK